MLRYDKSLHPNVYIATENNFLFQGMLSLLQELFIEVSANKVHSISEIKEGINNIDLIIYESMPGERVFDWFDCSKFKLDEGFKAKVLKIKTLLIYPRREDYDRNFHCPVIDAVVYLNDALSSIRRSLYWMYLDDKISGAKHAKIKDCGTCPGKYLLTSRDEQILNYLQAGLSTKEIAVLTGCETKSISNFRRGIMKRFHIQHSSDFVQWLKLIYKSQSGTAYPHEIKCAEYSNDTMEDIPAFTQAVDKYEQKRIIEIMQSLTLKHTTTDATANDVWLTTREIANAMDISIYSMRYMLNQLANTGKVQRIRSGRGRNNTLCWQLNLL
ncbi:FaeA/PapI family transcriptional regulator [Enterobacillus tribolii]|uniref:Regulatory LuxR family protein n=1 Tax=Enterobacillus tribolii TaxID=1487935 RepID=A0A370QQC5_9GAMM|nr:FaeA/PapI family transcriptional regulator [Enterobacillus tribolii]MBW7981592.1 LuxR family transcriptional regulator [Enterobacillus tribolii]RDK90970.1 regulatory LuxR family protein [Enterobacillus tribolii]